MTIILICKPDKINSALSKIYDQFHGCQIKLLDGKIKHRVTNILDTE